MLTSILYPCSLQSLLHSPHSKAINSPRRPSRRVPEGNHSGKQVSSGSISIQIQAARSKLPVLVTVMLLLTNVHAATAQNSAEVLIERTYSETLRYRCRITMPARYEMDPQKTWPMILFLHGGGTPGEHSLDRMTAPLSQLPAIVVAPICPPSADGPRYTNWNWKMLGEVVRELSSKYRVDPEMRSVIGFSMGGSGAWELPSFEDRLFAKSVVIAGVCHPWSLRHYPKTKVWVFVGMKDYMRKEQQETVTSAQRFGVNVVESTWKDADHGGVFRKTMRYQPMLEWLVTSEDLRSAGAISP